MSTWQNISKNNVLDKSPLLIDQIFSKNIRKLEEICFIKAVDYDLLDAIENSKIKYIQSLKPQVGLKHISYLPFTTNQSTSLQLYSGNKTASSVEANENFNYNNYIRDSSIWPYSAFGLIFIEDQNYSTPMWSSGVLIGPNLVLTTAESVYDTKNKKKYDNITFYPGVKNNSNTALYGKAEAIRTYYSDIFEKSVTTEGEENGHALLVLKDAIGYKTGYLGLYLDANSPPPILKNMEMIGHFYSIQDGKKQNFELWSTPK